MLGSCWGQAQKPWEQSSVFVYYMLQILPDETACYCDTLKKKKKILISFDLPIVSNVIMFITHVFFFYQMKRVIIFGFNFIHEESVSTVCFVVFSRFERCKRKIRQRLEEMRTA